MLEEFEDYQREEQQRGVLEAELAPGETLSWQGAPRGRIRVRGTWLIRLCGIIWLACWLSAALPLLAAVVFLGELMGLVFLLFTLPWGALGLWMAYLNPARQRARIESSVYAVTGGGARAEKTDGRRRQGRAAFRCAPRQLRRTAAPRTLCLLRHRRRRGPERGTAADGCAEKGGGRQWRLTRRRSPSRRGNWTRG